MWSRCREAVGHGWFRSKVSRRRAGAPESPSTAREWGVLRDQDDGEVDAGFSGFVDIVAGGRAILG